MLAIAAFQSTDLFEFSKPNREPRGTRWPEPHAWAVIESCLQSRHQTFRDRHRPPARVGFRIALDESAANLSDGAANSNTPGADVDIFDVQPGQFTKPQPGIGEDQHHVALGPAGF
jgi:hypothetical protein